MLLRPSRLLARLMLVVQLGSLNLYAGLQGPMLQQAQRRAAQQERALHQRALSRTYTTHEGHSVQFEHDLADGLQATITEDFTGRVRKQMRVIVHPEFALSRLLKLSEQQQRQRIFLEYDDDADEEVVFVGPRG
ncbi:MAG: hypothetical protein AAF310_05540, partial [Myxococcota bacterium]